MQQLNTFIEANTTFTFIVAIALAIILSIVLIIVIAALRVKFYRQQYFNLVGEKQFYLDKSEQLDEVLHAEKITNAKLEQELQHYDETKEELKALQHNLDSLQNTTNELRMELTQALARLEASENLFENLTLAQNELQENHDTLHEENRKMHINNARLLMKLEK